MKNNESDERLILLLFLGFVILIPILVHYFTNRPSATKKYAESDYGRFELKK